MDTNQEISLEALNQAENINLNVGEGCYDKCCGNCRYWDRSNEYCGYRSVHTSGGEYCGNWED